MSDSPRFVVGSKDFLFDGEPIRLLSGALHYFRVHPDQWADRLAAARAMGLNTVETYLPWNLHEPEPGRHDFSGGLDVERFVALAEEAGLFVLLRPGPYICAEWELGGLPWWLLRDPDMRLRSSYQPFLDAVDAWFDVLIPKLLPMLTTRGGPALMVQVENEFGSYGADPDYLTHLRDVLLRRGVDVPLFTSDGPEEHMLTNGLVDGVLGTVNFGSRAEEAFKAFRGHRPDGPLMCMEFWCGWFDHWGERHHERDPLDAGATLDDILAAGASVNFYMWHGGTNFGYLNGANHGAGFEPTITSYDYDAPLSEWGAPTPKFEAFREVIAKHLGEPLTEDPPAVRLAGFGDVRLTESAAVLRNLVSVGRFDQPPTVEEAGIGHGFAVYRASLPAGATTLRLPVVHDRAQVLVDGVEVGVLERDGEGDTVALPPGGALVEILLENQGRVNYGPHLHDRKGLLGGVLVDGVALTGWEVLRLTEVGKIHFGQQTGGPVYRRGVLRVDEPADTFVDLPGFTKGVVWVNGFNLGRYWDRGPQTRLYVPKPVLVEGANEVVVLDLHPGDSDTVRFMAEPALGEPDVFRGSLG
ncbi:beta-galactosidase [Actinokineospora alba]|uniref:Beta-galactosidase n=1 Tax=Actinokineospora alba TaxID=504798 RepID=A0A1H0I752_9PSEU|nr:beta-galactosidase family protein [Actinokineospora alba]TDP64578.1 beta-galactosidase [Actinokineospora alba]SDI86798.1 beta-galactosidase [Actinokineospora alba]SDO27080.1 beta-galactosidase [Actinokineospora alba]